MFPRNTLNRRHLLRSLSGGFAMTAFSGMCAGVSAEEDPLAAKRCHFAAKADSVIFIYATGGVSHVDTFVYKAYLMMDHG